MRGIRRACERDNRNPNRKVLLLCLFFSISTSSQLAGGPSATAAGLWPNSAGRPGGGLVILGSGNFTFSEANRPALSIAAALLSQGGALGSYGKSATATLFPGIFSGQPHSALSVRIGTAAIFAVTHLHHERQRRKMIEETRQERFVCGCGRARPVSR